MTITKIEELIQVLDDYVGRLRKVGRDDVIACISANTDYREADDLAVSIIVARRALGLKT